MNKSWLFLLPALLLATGCEINPRLSSNTVDEQVISSPVPPTIPLPSSNSTVSDSPSSSSLVSSSSSPMQQTLNPNASSMQQGTNAVVVANPGTWYYFAQSGYQFARSPYVDNDCPHIAFSKMVSGTNELRYQPTSFPLASYSIHITAVVENGYLLYPSSDNSYNRVDPDNNNIVEINTTNLLSETKPFYLVLKPNSYNTGMRVDVTSFEVIYNDYELSLANNMTVASHPDKWFYWAEGNYSLSQTPRKMGSAIFFEFDSLAMGKNYQLRYMPALADETEFNVSFKVTLYGDGSILYGLGNDDDISHLDMTSGNQVSLSYHGYRKTNEGSTYYPFYIQVVPNSTQAISLRVDDFVIEEGFKEEVAPSQYDVSFAYNAEVRSHPAHWYYYSSGSLGTHYTFDGAIKYYYNGKIVLPLLSSTSGKEIILRYQPDYPTNTHYRMEFDVELSQPGSISYGYLSQTQGEMLSRGIKYHYSSSNVVKTSSSDGVFEIKVIPANNSLPLKAIISDIRVINEDILDSESIAKKYENLFDIGAAIKPSSITSDASLMKHFTTLTPEYNMKWGQIETVQGSPDYTALDNIVNYAVNHGKKVRGHTLVWHKALPSWVSEVCTSKSVALELMRNHIEEMMLRYGDTMYCYDVVNEVLHNAITSSQLANNDLYRTGSNEISGSTTMDWYNLCGTDFIKEAFRTAEKMKKEHHLSTKLFYNDYSLSNPNKREACVRMIQMLKNENIEIDGVGMQSHFKIKNYIGREQAFLNDFENAIKAYTELGVDVHISELDIDIATGYTANTDLDVRKAKQNELFTAIYSICRNYATSWKAGAGRITNMTTWGVKDSGNSENEIMLLFNHDRSKKSAVDQIMNF